jgi:hypothetical protein
MFFGPIHVDELYAVGANKDAKKRKPYHMKAKNTLRNSTSNLDDSDHDEIDLIPVSRSFSFGLGGGGGNGVRTISNEKEALQLIIMKFFENQSSYKYFTCVDGSCGGGEIGRRSASASGAALLRQQQQQLQYLAPNTTKRHSVNNNNKLSTSVSWSRLASSSKRNAFQGNYHCYYSSLHIQAAQVFRSMDIDYNNKLTYAEFERGLMLAYSFAKRLFNGDILRRLFLMFDINKDGFIDFSRNRIN